MKSLSALGKHADCSILDLEVVERQTLNLITGRD
jgi:hypothetical protein